MFRNVYDGRINMGFRRIYSNCVPVWGSESVEGVLRGFSGRVSVSIPPPGPGIM